MATLAACGSSKSTPKGSLEIDPSEVTISVGGTQAFTVSLVLSGKTTDVTSAATWSSNDPTIATVDPSTGIATGVANGMTIIVGHNSGLTVSAKLTVSDATLTSIAVSPNKPTIAPGTTEQFTAMGTFSDMTTRDVSKDSSIRWKSSSTDKATIDGTGLATAVAAGTSTISAAIGDTSGSTTLTVSGTTLTSLSIDPPATSIAKGTTKQLTVTATFSDKTTQDLTSQATWSSSADDTAAVSDDDGSKGLVSGKSQGDATITATVMGMSATSGVNVTDASLTSIALDPATISVPKGLDQVFAAIGTFSDGTTQDISSTVVWTTSDANAAAVSNAAGSKGRATTLATGEVKITATTGTISSNAKLTITDAALKSIAVSGSASIAKGTKANYTALATYSDNTTADITNLVTWTSDNMSFASVSNADGSHGQVTGEGVGTTKLTAAIESISASANITVTDATLTTIAVSPGTKSLADGTTQQFIAIGTYSDGTTQDITSSSSWVSGNTDHATVSNSAGTRGLATAVAAGTANITASIAPITSAASVLTVTSATLTSIAVTPATKSIAKGTTQQFVATGTFSDATTQDLSSQAVWSTLDTNVATISSTTPSKGLASAVNGGTTTVRATVNSVAGTATLTVTGATLTGIAITPPTPSVANGSTTRLVATGTYSDASTQDLTSSVVWTSGTTSVATISNESTTHGRVSALTVGTTGITAAYAGLTSPSVTLTVTAAVLTAIEVSPAGDSLPKGLTSQYSATGTYSDSTHQDLTASVLWATGNAAMATITNGNAGGLLSAVDVGSTTVTATFMGVMGSTTLDVTGGMLTGITITTTGPDTIPRGATQSYIASGSYSDNTVQDLTSIVTWASSNSAIHISNAGGSKGSVTSSATGDTIITASTGGVMSNSLTLTISAARLSSITVAPSAQSLPKGASQLFAATGHYTDASTLDISDQVSWTTSNIAIATVDAVTGNATAVGVGGATITATFGAISGAATLTVTNAALVSVNVTPAGSIIAKFTKQHFIATGTYTDNTTQDLTSAATWTTDDSSIVVVSNTSGLVGLASALAPGNVTVTATVGSISGHTAFTVSNANLVSIDVTPASITAPKGLQQPYQAVGRFDDTSSQDLTSQVSWTSDTPSVATISNSLGSEGSASTLGTGVALIGASFQFGSSTVTSGPAVLNVTAAVPVSLQINGVFSVAKGVQIHFTAQATFTDGTTNDVTSSVTWSTADSSIAGACTVGGFPCVDTFLVGDTFIRGSIAGVSAPVTAARRLTVTQQTLVSIAVTPPAGSLAKGLNQQFVAAGTYTDGSHADLTTQVTWSTSDPTLVSISNAAGSEGLASALNTTSSVTVQAVLGTVTGSTTLTVTSAVLTALQVTPDSLTIAKGLTPHYVATGIFSDSTQQVLTTSVAWSTPDHGVATVNDSTGSKGILTAVDVGSTTVNVDYLGIHGSTPVTVSAATLQTISVTSLDSSVAAGSSEQFHATGVYTDNTTVDLTTSATWSSDDPALSIVFNTGAATGASAGSANVTASYAGLSGSLAFTVSPAALVSITVGSNLNSIPKGVSLNFSATGHYTDATTQDLTTSVAWSSTPNAMGSVSISSGLGGGVATALTKGGPVTITATDVGSGKHDSKPLTITDAVVTSLDVTPMLTNVAVGTKRQFTAVAHFSDGGMSTVTADPTTTWVSSDGTVATVSNALGSRGLATASGGGSTTIQATYGGYTTSSALNVTVATLASIAVTPVSPSTPLHFNVAFKATGTYTDATTQDLTNQVAWTSSNTGIATIDNTSGLAGNTSTLAPGSTTITASYTTGIVTRTGSTTLIVTPATLTSIAVTPTAGSIAQCDCEELTVTGTFSDSTTYDITTNQSLGIVSSDDNTVRVFQSGSLWLACSDSNPGTATVTASYTGSSPHAGMTTAINSGSCN